VDRQRIKRLLIGEFSVKRLLRSMLWIVLIVYGVLFLFAFFFAEKVIFLPQPSGYRDSREIIKLTSKNGKHISALYLPNAKARYTILYSHGNANDIGSARPMLEMMRDMGFSIFAYDYQGYGTSEGEPTEKNACEDVEAVYDYLTTKLNIPANRIITYGHSLGGAMAIDLAAKKPVAALVVESSFTTAFRVITRIPILPFDRFYSLAKIQKAHCPVLIMHGKQDKTIAVEHGKTLFDCAEEPKRLILVERAGHDDAMVIASNRFLSALRELGLAIN
jgi:fermentation-respiration switch protein FrsA (DUF1100 family)